jgi:hypothetical protein
MYNIIYCTASLRKDIEKADRMNAIFRELLKTEIDYVVDMTNLVNIYMKVCILLDIHASAHLTYFLFL